MSRALAVVFMVAVLMLAGVQSHGGEEASPGPYPGRNWAKQGECGPYHNWDACRPGYCCSQRGYCGNSKPYCEWCKAESVFDCQFLPPTDNWSGSPMPIPKEVLDRNNNTISKLHTGDDTEAEHRPRGNSSHDGNSSDPSGHGSSGQAGTVNLPGMSAVLPVVPTPPKDTSAGVPANDVVVTDTKSGVAPLSMLFPIVCVMIISAITL